PTPTPTCRYQIAVDWLRPGCRLKIVDVDDAGYRLDGRLDLWGHSKFAAQRDIDLLALPSLKNKSHWGAPAICEPLGDRIDGMRMPDKDGDAGGGCRGRGLQRLDSLEPQPDLFRIDIGLNPRDYRLAGFEHIAGDCKGIGETDGLKLPSRVRKAYEGEFASRFG